MLTRVYAVSFPGDDVSGPEFIELIRTIYTFAVFSLYIYLCGLERERERERDGKLELGLF